MKRERGGKDVKGKVYWWSTEIAEIRGRCNMWRRRLIRAKDRKDQELETQLAGELKTSRKELRKAIEKAKKRAWDELLERLNRDPWGRPYKMIMSKIKSDNVNIGEKLSIKTMEDILSKLFPKDRGVNVYRDGGYEAEEWIPAVTGEEMSDITTGPCAY